MRLKPYPNHRETQKLLKTRLNKSARYRGRAALEAIRATLDESMFNRQTKDKQTYRCFDDS